MQKQVPASTAVMNRIGTWPVVILGACVFFVFAGVFFVSSVSFSIPTVEEACGAPPLDVRFYSSAAEVDRFLNDCGPAGRAAYQNLQVADLVYPGVFGLFVSAALALAFKHLVPHRPRVMGLAALGLVASGFDYLENVFAWRALGAFPNSASTNSVLGFASAAKTISSWLVSIMLVAIIVAIVVRFLLARVGSAPGSGPHVVPSKVDGDAARSHQLLEQAHG